MATAVAAGQRRRKCSSAAAARHWRAARRQGGGGGGSSLVAESKATTAAWRRHGAGLAAAWQAKRLQRSGSGSFPSAWQQRQKCSGGSSAVAAAAAQRQWAAGAVTFRSEQSQPQQHYPMAKGDIGPPLTARGSNQIKTSSSITIIILRNYPAPFTPTSLGIVHYHQ